MTLKREEVFISSLFFINKTIMKLNKDFPHKIYLDKRVLVNGIKKNNVNYENHIELSEWIQTLIDNEELEIPCTCDASECILEAFADIFKFLNNGLSYQFLDIVHNDKIGDTISNLNIVIVDDSNLSGNRTATVVNSPFYPYPIIKLTKPVSEAQVGNIDEPEEFTYKLTGTCNGEEIESNIVEVTIYPVSVNLELIIN